MKINKIENRTTFLILSFAIFLISIKYLSFISIICGNIIALFLILLFDNLNIYKYKVTKFIILLISIFIATFLLNYISYYIDQNILRNNSIYLISITFLLTTIILGNKGYHTIIKVIILISYFLLLISILGFITTSFYLNIENFFIIAKSNILKESLGYSLLITYAYFLIYPITKTKFKTRDLLISLSFQIINYLFIILILGKTLLNLYKYPFIIIFKKVSLLNFIERIEIIFTIHYLFFFFFLLLLIYYQIRYILSLNIKKEKKLTIVLIIISLFIFSFSFII